MTRVAVLFARRDSVYKSFPCCDVYDADRDALTFPGGMPVIAHPPCRGWGNLRHMSNATQEEKDLAVWAVGQVRRWGGVLEHPKRSKLWPHVGLPMPGEGRDEFGGWTLGIPQQWWGHRAEKLTLLYIVGCAPKDIPPLPLVLGEAECTISTCTRMPCGGRRPARRPEVSKAEREHTPIALAEWLYRLAQRCAA